MYVWTSKLQASSARLLLEFCCIKIISSLQRLRSEFKRSRLVRRTGELYRARISNLSAETSARGWDSEKKSSLHILRVQQFTNVANSRFSTFHFRIIRTTFNLRSPFPSPLIYVPYPFSSSNGYNRKSSSWNEYWRYKITGTDRTYV